MSGEIPTGIFGEMPGGIIGQMPGGLMGNMPGGILGDMPCLFGHIEMGCRGDILMGLFTR